MTATITEPAAPAPVVSRATPDERRATIVGFVLLAMALAVLWVFALGVPAEATSTFNLSLPTDSFKDLSWTFNTRTVNLIIAALLAVLGVLCLRRRWLKRTNTMLGVGLGLLVFAFLAWAAADGSFSLVGMLRSTVIASVVITLGALCGLMCERAGVVNIGIEGQLLTGAFVAVVLSSAYGTWAGVAGAMLVGALLGLLLVWLAIRFNVDQIIAGVVINILALGITSFLASRVLSEAQDLNAPARVPSWRIPILADIPMHRPDVLRPHLLHLRHPDPRLRAPIRPVPHPLGPSGAFGRRAPQGRRHAGDQRVPRSATAMWCWAGSSPGSAGPSCRCPRWRGSRRT